MKTIVARLMADTPSFFKKVIAVGLSVAGVGTAILALPATLAAAGVVIALPAIVTTVGGYLFAGGTIAATVGKMAVADPNSLPK